MLKRIPKHNYHHQPPHNFVSLQKASTDSCLLAIIYQFICIHRLAILSGSEPNNSQQMNALCTSIHWLAVFDVL